MKGSYLPSFFLISFILGYASAQAQNASSIASKREKSGDSYLEAYSKSRVDAEKMKSGVVVITAKDGEVKQGISNRDDSYNSLDYDSYAPPLYSAPDSSYSSAPTGFAQGSPQDSVSYHNNDYAPPPKYGAPPPPKYGAPPPQKYGPPTDYGSSQGSYHQSGPYGPSVVPNYHPPAPVYGPPKPSYGVPYTAPGFDSFFNKLSLKLDILTIAKILLKIIIFKKIVKFIGIICLLLFIPKLIKWKKSSSTHNDYSDEEDRAFGRHNNHSMTALQLFLEDAIRVYSTQQDGCDAMGCRAMRVLDAVDDRYSLNRLGAVFQPATAYYRN